MREDEEQVERNERNAMVNINIFVHDVSISQIHFFFKVHSHIC